MSAPSPSPAPRPNAELSASPSPPPPTLLLTLSAAPGRSSSASSTLPLPPLRSEARELRRDPAGSEKTYRPVPATLEPGQGLSLGSQNPKLTTPPAPALSLALIFCTGWTLRTFLPSPCCAPGKARGLVVVIAGTALGDWVRPEELSVSMTEAGALTFCCSCRTSFTGSDCDNLAWQRQHQAPTPATHSVRKSERKRLQQPRRFCPGEVFFPTLSPLCGVEHQRLGAGAHGVPSFSPPAEVEQLSCVLVSQ